MDAITAKRVEIALHYRAKKREHKISIAAIRRAEIRRLYHNRHGHTLPNNDGGRDFALVMAHHLARCPGDRSRSIRCWLEVQTPWMSAADIETMIRSVLTKPLRWKADTIARRLHVTEAERSRLRLTTIGAVDMTKAERRLRRQLQHRVRERERRSIRGAKSRAAYLAGSLSRTKPWQRLGMSRRSWYRAGKPAEVRPSCLPISNLRIS